MIELRDVPFDPYVELGRFQASIEALRGKYGATSVFIGTMRDFNEGDSVQKLWLEHYPGMTERQLSCIVNEATQRWPILGSLVIHRVGEIEPADVLVVIGVWSSHRASAMDASRYIIESLKSRAPFWKKEMLDHGESSRWVQHNTPG